MYLTQSTMTIFIAAISALIAVLGYKRFKEKDIGQTYATQARTAMQLDTISTSINNIALDIKDLKADVKAQDGKISIIDTRLARVEESSKSAHKRIDELEIYKIEKQI